MDSLDFNLRYEQRNLIKGENSVKLIAESIFNTPEVHISKQYVKNDFYESADILELFEFYLELLIYGVDILTSGSFTIFDIISVDNDITLKIRTYFKCIGVQPIIEHVDNIDIIDESYCQLTYYKYDADNKPWFIQPSFYSVLYHNFIYNKNYVMKMDLEDNQACFKSKHNKMYVIKFKNIKHEYEQERPPEQMMPMMVHDC